MRLTWWILRKSFCIFTQPFSREHISSKISYISWPSQVASRVQLNPSIDIKPKFLWHSKSVLHIHSVPNQDISTFSTWFLPVRANSYRSWSFRDGGWTSADFGKMFISRWPNDLSSLSLEDMTKNPTTAWGVPSIGIYNLMKYIYRNLGNTSGRRRLGSDWFKRKLYQCEPRTSKKG